MPGGFPSSPSIFNRTFNHFNKPFSGCLEGVQISSFNSKMSTDSKVSQPVYYDTLRVQDLYTFEGENIGECELFDEFVNN